MDLIVNQNSYATVADADDLLLSSPRAALRWSTLGTTDKTGALLTAFRLLEQQRWAGTKTGRLNVKTAVVTALGTGYAVGDVLTLVGGSGAAATFRVDAIDGGGGVTDLTMLDAGLYTALPASPAATTVASGLGIGCTLTLTQVAQQAAWPRTGVVDRYGEAVDSTTVPAALRTAQAIYAFELAVDPELEAARDANKNIASLNAGSVGVSYFRPTDDAGRFPASVQEVVSEFLAGGGGSAAIGAPIATGTGATSDIDEDRYELSGPL